jgi:hypothetical protein
MMALVGTDGGLLNRPVVIGTAAVPGDLAGAYPSPDAGAAWWRARTP